MCTFNRVDNVKFWLKEFPDWNLEARNMAVGGVALGLAVFLLMLYGGEKGNRRVMDVHQELKRLDFLTPWCDAPADAEIIFVSAHSSHSIHFLT